MSGWTTHVDLTGRFVFREGQLGGRTVRHWNTRPSLWPYCHRAYGCLLLGIGTWRCQIFLRSAAQ